MAKFSNYTSPLSSDALPSNPYPEAAIPTRCSNCYEKISEDPCPHCGTQNDIEYQPDFEAGEQEYDKYNDL